VRNYFLLGIIISTGVLFSSVSSNNHILYNEAIQSINEYNGEAGGLNRAREIAIELTKSLPNSADALILNAKLLFKFSYISYDDYREDMLFEVKRICNEVIQNYPDREEPYLLISSVYRVSKKMKSYEKAFNRNVKTIKSFAKNLEVANEDDKAGLDAQNTSMYLSNHSLVDTIERDREIYSAVSNILLLLGKDNKENYDLFESFTLNEDTRKALCSIIDYMSIIEKEPKWIVLENYRIAMAEFGLEALYEYPFSVWIDFVSYLISSNDIKESLEKATTNVFYNLER
jgi:hypothetical protein